MNITLAHFGTSASGVHPHDILGQHDPYLSTKR